MILTSVLSKSTFDIKRKEILYLGFSLHEILKGFSPNGSLEVLFPSCHRESLKSSLIEGISDVFPGDDDAHGNLVIDFVVKREDIRRATLVRSDRQNDRAKDRHDLGVRAEHSYSPGDSVMLWDAKTAGKKLRHAWRGPFIVTGYEGNLRRSYTLRQVDGSPIPRHYYGDHLKPFRRRESYLITREEEEIPVCQNIRLGKAAFKLPKCVSRVPGAQTHEIGLPCVRPASDNTDSPGQLVEKKYAIVTTRTPPLDRSIDLGVRGRGLKPCFGNARQLVFAGALSYGGVVSEPELRR
ncbi:hypothetical protein K3495_g14890 [Podosphaera aphanis]|nr:hypothetical protein K3495_g14890 [Podosphaera aphanis]